MEDILNVFPGFGVAAFGLVTLFIALGIYKIVKDWLPW